MTIVLAAGGTGGHVFPAEALAAALGARGHSLALITDGRSAAYGGALGALPTRRLSVLAPVGGIGQKIKSGMSLVTGFFAARRVLRELNARLVIGFGGYPSVAPVLAAHRMGIACLIHEQNAVLGRANRMLASGSIAIATSFPHVERLPRGTHATLTGNPVRPAILDLRARPYTLPGPRLAILVTGGSQGATVFSQILPAALALLPAETRAVIDVTQQVRAEDRDAVDRAYAGLGMTPTLAPFFADLPERLEHAQLVIARAGASTVAELSVAGRPSILVPYPSAMDDHQSHNAVALAAAGGANVMAQPAFTPVALAATLAEYVAAPQTLSRMASAAWNFGRPDAAERLADLALSLIAAKREHAA